MESLNNCNRFINNCIFTTIETIDLTIISHTLLKQHISKYPIFFYFPYCKMYIEKRTISLKETQETSVSSLKHIFKTRNFQWCHRDPFQMSTGYLQYLQCDKHDSKERHFFVFLWFLTRHLLQESRKKMVVEHIFSKFLNIKTSVNIKTSSSFVLQF